MGRICNLILLFIIWVRSFSKVLLSVKFAEYVLAFVILLYVKNAKIAQLLSLTLILTLISRAD